MPSASLAENNERGNPPARPNTQMFSVSCLPIVSLFLVTNHQMCVVFPAFRDHTYLRQTIKNSWSWHLFWFLEVQYFLDPKNAYVFYQFVLNPLNQSSSDSNCRLASPPCCRPSWPTLGANNSPRLSSDPATVPNYPSQMSGGHRKEWQWRKNKQTKQVTSVG